MGRPLSRTRPSQPADPAPAHGEQVFEVGTQQVVVTISLHVVVLVGIIASRSFIRKIRVAADIALDRAVFHHGEVRIEEEPLGIWHPDVPGERMKARALLVPAMAVASTVDWFCGYPVAPYTYPTAAPKESLKSMAAVPWLRYLAGSSALSWACTSITGSAHSRSMLIENPRILHYFPPELYVSLE